MNKNNSSRRWLSLINIPIQMGATIFLASLLGDWLDGKYNWQDGRANKICTLMGVGLALYQVIKQVNQLNKNN